MAFLERGLVLAVIMLSINAVLLVGGIVSSADSSYLPALLPAGLENYNANYDASSINSADFQYKEGTLEADSYIEGSANDPWVYASKLVGSLPKVVMLVGFMLFGYAVILLESGVPFFVVFLIATPISAIMLITFFFLFMEFVRSVLGR